MYVAGEIVGAHLSGEAPEPRRVVTVTALGATGDAVCLRAFHAVMDCSDEERIGKWGPNETKVNKLVGKRSNSHRKIMQKYKIQFL